MNVWTIQRRQDSGQWQDHAVTNRFVDSLHLYADAEEPKRLLRNGRVLRMHTSTEQLDLFAEDDPAAPVGWPSDKPIYVASISTRNFLFQGAGETEIEARLALRVAWTRHCDNTPDADPTLLEEDDFLYEATLTTFVPGRCYRDGEEIQHHDNVR